MSEWLEKLEDEFTSLETSIEGYFGGSDDKSDPSSGRYERAVMAAVASAVSVAGLSYYNRDRSYMTKGALAAAAGAVGSLVADTVNSCGDKCQTDASGSSLSMLVAPAVAGGIYFLADSRMPETQSNNIEAVLVAVVSGLVN
jgi:hypothetical protein